MKHELLETKTGLLGVLIAVVVSFGGLAEIVPLMALPQSVEPSPGVVPYGALELEGRDIYIREGCYNCHSQMIRPFQFGSKRTGPDLARVGGRYTDEWMRIHLVDPRDVVPESNMPGFPWLERNVLDPALTGTKMQRLRALGVPYTDEQIAGAGDLVSGRTEMDALIAYLQALGRTAAPAGNGG